MTFKASFDWMVKLITIAFCLFFLTFFVLWFINIETSRTPIFSVIMLIILGIVYLFHVQNYEVTHKSIKINRLIRSKQIDFSTIKNVYKVKNDDLGFMIRTFGNGGIFGFMGFYKSQIYGNMRLFGTQQRNYVIVETNLTKYVLTPDEPFDFVKSVENRVGVV
jgi:Bacterial PH domain